MLKKEIRTWVKYLIEERKSFKIVFANGKVEIVEYRGYCWVLNGKAYDATELIEKCVRFQNNGKKFIISFEIIEEVEEVENLTSDLFEESDIEYAEEAIRREEEVQVAADINLPVFEAPASNSVIDKLEQLLSEIKAKKDKEAATRNRVARSPLDIVKRIVEGGRI